MPQKGGKVIVNWISDWASAIIVAVIIGTIIEMILPEGNSKKYIKVVIGIYVLFTIVSPVITKITGKDIEISDILDLEEYIEDAKETSKIQNTMQDNNENDIMNVYLEGIKNDIKAKAETKGYDASNINVKIENDDSYNILSINMNVRKINAETQNNNKNDNKDINNEIKPVKCVNKIEIDIGDGDKMNNNEKNKGEKRREYFK